MVHIKTTLCFLILSTVAVITAQAQFTSGSGIVYTTNTTDKVGIGTTTPSAKLDVKGSGRFTDAIAATSGTGLELDYLIPSDYARVLAYDRTNNVYKSLKINGSALTLNDISNGNVGVGTGTPGVKLDVKGSGRFTDAGSASSGIGLEMDYIVASDYGRILSYDRTNSAYKPLRINGSTILLNESSSGNVGISTTNPTNKLQIGNFATSNTNALIIPGTYNFEQVKLGQYGNGNAGLELINHSGASNSYGIRFMTNIDQVSGLQIQYAPGTSAYNSLSYTTGLFMGLNGSIGIGTTNPGSYKLAVNGTIAATAIKVTQTGWADFVFDDDYKLRPLSEVENYINQNKHLPGVPSAKEVTANGIDLGDNQAVLLKKIEELTLYSIEQEKKLADKDQKIETLSKKLDAVLSRLEKLEKNNQQ